jgi:hypothetical protein
MAQGVEAELKKLRKDQEGLILMSRTNEKSVMKNFETKRYPVRLET